MGGPLSHGRPGGVVSGKAARKCRANSAFRKQQELVTWLERGPTPEENLAAYNGPILREKIQRHFGQLYALNGLYDLLHRLGYNDLMPRTTHPDTDPAVLESFKKKSSRKPSKRSGKPTPASGS